MRDFILSQGNFAILILLLKYMVVRYKNILRKRTNTSSKKRRNFLCLQIRLYFIFNIWNVDVVGLPFNINFYIVYRGTERTFFKVWWYCGSHGYEGSNNTAFKVWNLIFYFLKNYHVRFYIKNLLVRLKIEQ